MIAFKFKTSSLLLLGAGLAGALFFTYIGGVPAWAQEKIVIGEQPAITEHLDQDAINAGRVSFRQLFDAGEKLFNARFNVLDGQGRPGATGNNNPPTSRAADPSDPGNV